MYDRSSMKLNAKAAMKAASPKVWLVTLILSLLTGAISGLTGSISSVAGQLLGGVSVIGMTQVDSGSAGAAAGMVGMLLLIAVVSGVLGLVGGVLNAVLSYGYAGYSLKVYRREPAGIGNLFDGFRRFGAVVGAGLLSLLFQGLWLMLFSVIALAVGAGGSALCFLPVMLMAESDGAGAIVIVSTVLSVILILVAVVGFCVAALWVAYRYILAPYFVMSDPACGAMDAIRRSKESMKGNKGKRFMLDLSFIGWDMLIGLVTGAIATVGVLLVMLLGGGSILAAINSSGGGGDALAAGGGLVTILVGVLFTILTVAAAIMGLWLTGYKSVSAAGFFHEITATPAQPYNSYSAPVPPQGAQTVWTPAPQPQQAWTPQPPAPTAAPQAGQPAYHPFGVESAPAAPAPEAADVPADNKGWED